MGNLAEDIQTMAYNMGDEFGCDAETIKTIASIYGINAAVIQELLMADPDIYFGSVADSGVLAHWED